MSRAEHEFRQLDDLVLDLKGLVLVRRYRERSGAPEDELEMFSEQIQRVRERLVDVVRSGPASWRAQPRDDSQRVMLTS